MDAPQHPDGRPGAGPGAGPGGDPLADPTPLYQQPWALGLAIPLVLLTCFGACCLDVPSYVAGETDLFGNYRFEAEAEARRESMSRMARVHAELFPDWLLARAQKPSEANAEAAAEAYQALLSEVHDAELRAILDQLDAEFDVGDMASGGQAVYDLFEQWNDRLAALGEPFYIHGIIVARPDHHYAVASFYRKLASPVVEVEPDRRFEARLVERIDRTNIREAYLGATPFGADYAFVVVDRLTGFAADDVLPLLDEERLDEQHPDDEPLGADAIARSFAEPVRAELREALGDEVYAALTEAAGHRRDLRQTIEAIEARRSCGSTFRFVDVPWDGFNPRDLDRFDAYAERDKLEVCPTIKFAEADQLRAASEALGEPDAQAALESLVAFVSRGIAVHEARHVADHGLVADRDTPLPCDACPERMHPVTRRELSAYVASVAWSQSPATTLYQACANSGGGAHGRAVRFMMGELDRSCADGPPDDLNQALRDLELRLFGHLERIMLPADYPRRLRLRRYR